MLIYKNHYVHIKKLHIFLGNHNCKYVCRCCCLNSYKSQSVLTKHKQQCGERDTTSLSLSIRSQIYWNSHFHKNQLYFRIYAEFEANNEIDNSSIGNKATINYKQNQILNG